VTTPEAMIYNIIIVISIFLLRHFQ